MEQGDLWVLSCLRKEFPKIVQHQTCPGRFKVKSDGEGAKGILLRKKPLMFPQENLRRRRCPDERHPVLPAGKREDCERALFGADGIGKRLKQISQKDQGLVVGFRGERSRAHLFQVPLGLPDQLGSVEPRGPVDYMKNQEIRTISRDLPGRPCQGSFGK